MILRIFAGLLSVWLIGFAIFAMTLPQPLGPRKTDGIVVLTGGPGRIIKGLERLEARDAKRMIITGVNPDVKRAELEEAYGYRRQFECCVALGFQAEDTRSNGIEAANWVRDNQIRSIRLITSDWHMSRALYDLRRELPEGVEIFSDGIRGEPSLSTLWKEYNKYLLRRASAVLGL